jgi:YD repeat-containing protein
MKRFDLGGIARAFLLIASFLAASAYGQVPDLMPQRGIYPNGSYSFDKLEAINKVNGILTYSIPVTTMPLGRGGMTVPINLTYSSALADAYAYSGFQSGSPVTYGAAQSSAFGGWSFTGYNYSLYEVSAPIQDCNTSPPPFQLGVIMPDGAHHVLKLYGQYDTYQNGTYWFNPETGQNPCSQQTLPTPLTYYTTDGSYIRVVINDSNPAQYPAGGPWTVFLPDGATASGAGWGAWSSGQPIAQVLIANVIQDRNGNRVTITTDAQSNVTLTDDLGRSITIANGVVTQAGPPNNPSSIWTLDTGGKFTIPLGTCTTKGQNGCGNYTGGGPASFRVPSDSGTLQFDFVYYPDTGELKSVTLPSGATTTYTYTSGPPTVVGITSLNDNYIVKQKQVSWTDQSDGGAVVRTETWNYKYSSIWYGDLCPGYCTSVTAPDGGTTTTLFVGTGGLKGTVAKETLPDGSGTEYLYQQNPAFYEAAQPAGGSDSANPFVRLSVHTAAQSGSPVLAAVEARTIDQNGNLTEDTLYDWIAYSQLTHDSNGYLTGFSGGSLLRDTTNTYQVSVPAATNGAGPPDNANGYWNPVAPKLRWLVKRSVISGTGIGAATEYSYDGNGNRTQERHWDSTKAASLPGSLNASNASITGYTFDSHGNLTDVTDPVGNATHYTYDANDLYLQTKVEAYNTSVASTFSYGWDFASGVMTSKTDTNNNVTTTYGYDAMGRLTDITEDSTGLKRKTNTTYDDANRRVIVKRDQYSSGDKALMSVTNYDQMGRMALTQQLENSGQSPTDAAAGIKVQTRYLYSGGNSYKLVSNPYREATSSAASSACNNNYPLCTMGWTVTRYDQDGRTVSEQSFDGSGLPAPWGSNGTSSGAVSTAYSAQYTTVTDQANYARQNQVDGLGRLTKVAEDPGNLNYQTAYGYDALDDLTCESNLHRGKWLRFGAAARPQLCLRFAEAAEQRDESGERHREL